MLLEIEGHSVFIDVKATKDYYDTAKSYKCPCPGCHNFIAAVDMLPKEIAQPLNRIGVDCRKLMRVSALVKQENGEILYDCTFRVVGTIEIAHHTSPKEASVLFRFSDDKKPFYPCKDFPEPCIEGSFTVSLPWIIKEKCNY